MFWGRNKAFLGIDVTVRPQSFGIAFQSKQSLLNQYVKGSSANDYPEALKMELRTSEDIWRSVWVAPARLLESWLGADLL
jgi:hypothetical protein